MIQTLVLTLLTALTLTACNKCNVEKGSYTSAGGSEQSTNLTLADKDFIVKHDNWQPGHYVARETAQINGSWTCSESLIKFTTNNKTFSAELITVGENPLGLKSNSKAIIFNENTWFDYLNKQMFYPD
ncbi:MAG: hypothetical protein OQK98_11505 [Gammaproteobacteria bacterium]|nr:hypothetical protein [Gammaproteobacteria bacterium]